MCCEESEIRGEQGRMRETIFEQEKKYVQQIGSIYTITLKKEIKQALRHPWADGHNLLMNEKKGERRCSETFANYPQTCFHISFGELVGQSGIFYFQYSQGTETRQSVTLHSERNDAQCGWCTLSR